MSLMPVTLRSFAKINLGLAIGPLRRDGFHDLRTVYQTIALHDIVRVQVARGAGIEIRCADPRVPRDQSNTCYRMVERAMQGLQARGRVVIEIEKRLPVQGGLGGASGNAVAALLGLERALKKQLSGAERLEIAAEVGSDLPLFLAGGTVLGVGHGEEVYPLPDLASVPCVIATPESGVSTPKAFADWDRLISAGPVELRASGSGERARTPATGSHATSHAALKLTPSFPSDRMLELGRAISAGLGGSSQGRFHPSKAKTGRAYSGVPVSKGRGRAETPLLDLVRTGIENDFERVVFPQYPELREVKSVLEQAGALYASLSGSGSAVYGLFRSRTAAGRAAVKLREQGIRSVVTTTVTRPQYWKKIFD
jgi:4-diphosphocytidyl-2-C-methyl-D-erythritol kinase